MKKNKYSFKINRKTQEAKIYKIILKDLKKQFFNSATLTNKYIMTLKANLLYSLYDKMIKKSILHKNKVAKNKSKLSKLVYFLNKI